MLELEKYSQNANKVFSKIESRVLNSRHVNHLRNSGLWCAVNRKWTLRALWLEGEFTSLTKNVAVSELFFFNKDAGWDLWIASAKSSHTLGSKQLYLIDDWWMVWCHRFIVTGFERITSCCWCYSNCTEHRISGFQGNFSCIIAVLCGIPLFPSNHIKFLYFSVFDRMHLWTLVITQWVMNLNADKVRSDSHQNLLAHAGQAPQRRKWMSKAGAGVESH